MVNNKIIYGIDLGTTNSAIARFENGQAVIKKSPTQGDVTPSCVAISGKGRILVGDRAYAQLAKDRCLSLTRPSYECNTFVEFKRIMGTDEALYSSNLKKCGLNPILSPESLSAEVLKTLRTYVLDDEVKEAVITVPALFNNNQKDATKRAAKLAGFDHFELIQEPVAASVAYGLASKIKNAYWLVFDFGGGTFDAALMRIEEGIMKAVDTAGNNHLGGKDIDAAIVDDIIIPYLRREYAIEECDKNPAFRPMWKAKAEEAKICLSFEKSTVIDTDLGEEYGSDDDGTDFELSLTLTQEDLEPVASPIFQKAIDITKSLLERNGLSGEDLGALILVGGPTHSPILRRMLREQITPNVDTSIDPMTAVACGAALYGSTIDVPEPIMDKRRDSTKIQLDVNVKSTSVEASEFAAVRFLKELSEGYDDDAVEVDFVRSDGEFNSGRVRIDTIGDAIELRLKADRTNLFEIHCYSLNGQELECQPQQVSIIQGIDGIGDAVMPKYLGISTVDSDGDAVFTPLEGMKKNLPLPAYGKNSVTLVTDRNVRPGMSTDIVRFPILQTDRDIDQLQREGRKLKSIYCDFQYDCYFTGDDVPSVLPIGSEVNLTFHADKSGTIDQASIDIPYLNLDIDISDRLHATNSKLADVKLYEAEIAEARKKLQSIGDEALSSELIRAAGAFDKAQTKDRDNKEQSVEDLKDVLAKIDEEYSLGDWQRMESKLNWIYRELSADNRKYGNDKTTSLIQSYKADMERIINAQNMDAANDIYDKMLQLDFKIAQVEYYISWIRGWSQNFVNKEWSNPTRARTLVDKGMEIINGGKVTADDLRPICDELWSMLPRTEKVQNQGLLHQRN